MRVVDALERFFSHTAPVDPGDRILVAFSGGPDSTALLSGLRTWASSRNVGVAAAHLDHGADAGSAARACQARALARRLEVPWISERCSIPELRQDGESPEEAARRVRYGFLERARRETGSRWIATAHHADDQAETVLLRLLQGSGLDGLAGIRPVRGAVVRPLLELPRRDLMAPVAAAGWTPVDDPTNRDLDLGRNRVRHGLLPHLADDDPTLPRRLASIARRARGLRSRLDVLLTASLQPRPAARGVSVDFESFADLPGVLRPLALSWLHRQAGIHPPPTGAAMEELERQMAAARGSVAGVGCHCGKGWCWRRRGSRLVLERARGAFPVNCSDDFTYTLEAPGEIVVEEISSRIRLIPGTLAPWMFERSAERAGLALALEPGERVEIRNRRPGDRLQPLGAPGRRKLKEVMIDRRVPREDRDRLPLLVVGGHIAWVPGVALDERFRLRDGVPVWTAEILPL